MKKVLVPIADGFEEIEAITIIDVLRRAGIEVITASITPKLEVTGSHNITIKVDNVIKELKDIDFDMIVLPGGMPGSVNLNQHEGLKSMLQLHRNKDKYIGAICAAPLVLGNLGLLNGQKATCYPGFEKFLDGAEITDEGVVYDNKIVTGKSAGMAMPFSLKLVEVLAGEELAKITGLKMLVN